jgi:hypothetical protein
MSLHDQIEYWATYADRDLTAFERMVISRPFKYSSYWRTWNRVIKPVWAGLPHGIVEVSLSTIPGAEKMRDIADMRIRNHVTAFDIKDSFKSSLPDDFRRKLIEGIGEEEAQFLLYGNIWDYIDWDRYRQMSAWHPGGGIPLAQVHINLKETPL